MSLLLALVATGETSSHREAPLILGDPLADNTDVYAFVSPDDPDMVTLISNWIPFQIPQGGPNFYPFGDEVKYRINIDNDADAVDDIVYEFDFETMTQTPDTFLYNTSTVDSPEDPDWNRPQQYTVTRIEGNDREVLAENLLTPPDNVGPRSTPEYEALAQAAVHELDGGTKVFAGQRDEGFYIDIGSIFDLLGLRPLNQAHAIPLPTADGRDGLAGLNVKSIALQVPKEDLLGDGDIIGVYATSNRDRTRVLEPAEPTENPPVGDRQTSGEEVQVSRLGNPLVNEVVVPLRFKDVFLSSRPEDDAAFLPLVQDPEPARLIEQLYGVDVPPAPRNDLVSIFLTGIQGVNKPAGGTPSEMVRLNTAVPPTPFDEQNRLGLLAGQADGFPNGRRVGDDVVDIELRALAGGTPFTPRFNVAPNNALTDGVDGNDKPYLETFPYLATPTSGYEATGIGSSGSAAYGGVATGGGAMATTRIPSSLMPASAPGAPVARRFSLLPLLAVGAALCVAAGGSAVVRRRRARSS